MLPYLRYVCTVHVNLMVVGSSLVQCFFLKHFLLRMYTIYIYFAMHFIFIYCTYVHVYIYMYTHVYMYNVLHSIVCMFWFQYVHVFYQCQYLQCRLTRVRRCDVSQATAARCTRLAVGLLPTASQTARSSTPAGRERCVRWRTSSALLSPAPGGSSVEVQHV